MIAVVYALVAGLFIHREIGVKDLLPVFKKSVVSSAVIMFIIATASLFSYLLNRQGVPDAAGEWLVKTFDGPAMYMLAVNIFLFIVGMFVETNASIIVLGPILADAAQRVGIDTVHFGTVMVVNLALGMITPPFGVNLFAAAQVANCSIDKMMKYLVVFIGVVFLCLMIVAYVPPISLALRDAIMR